eukprot:gene2793-1016_t
MDEKTTLCVSVQAGEHLLSGPDWIKIEDSKTLIDALVEVSGTQALGYQVQVVVSKEPSFTEAALVQVVNQVSMLRECGSIYVKFLLKSSVLPSQKRYEESKCKAERDTDVLSPLDTLHRQEQQKQDEDSIYNFINSTFDKPFESNYLNKLFSEHKLSPSTLSSLREELARKHSHKELEQYTTWSQQSKLASQSESKDTKAQSSDTRKQILTIWGNDCPVVEEGKTTVQGDDTGGAKDPRSKPDETVDGWTEKDQRKVGIAQKDELPLNKVENQKNEVKSERTSVAGKTPTNAKTKVTDQPKGKTLLPKTNRSTTLRAKKNAATTAGMLKAGKKDLAKSGMPVLCQKVIRACPSKVTQTKQRNSGIKMKEKGSLSTSKKSFLPVGADRKVTKKVTGNVSAWKTRTSKDKSDLDCTKVGNADANGRKKNFSGDIGKGNESDVIPRSSVENDELSRCGKGLTPATLERKEKNSPVAGKSNIDSVSLDSDEKEVFTLKSPAKEKNELSVSNDSGYVVCKDSREIPDVVNFSLEEKHNDSIKQWPTDNASTLDYLDTSSILEWEIVDSTKEEESSIDFQHEKQTGPAIQSFACEQMNKNLALQSNSDLASSEPGLFSNKEESPECFFNKDKLTSSPSRIPQMEKNDFQKSADQEFNSNDESKVLESSVSKAGVVKESSAHYDLFREKDGSNIHEPSSSFVDPKKDPFERRLKNSFDSFDIVDSSEMRRKLSNNVDNCIRRSESLGRDSSSPIKKKSGFFHQLKEKTIDLDCYILPTAKMESYSSSSEDLEKIDECQPSNMLKISLDSGNGGREKSPSTSDRSILNLTLDKVTSDGSSSLSVQTKSLEKTSPIFLSDVGRASPANRTFSLDEEDDAPDTKLSGPDNKETVVKGLTNDASSGSIAVEIENAKHEPETLEMQGKDDGYLLSNLDEHIECHVRRHWDESKGIMDQLLLTSLADLTSDLNASAERIVNTIRSSQRKQKTSTVNELSRIPSEAMNQAKGVSN